MLGHIIMMSIIELSFPCVLVRSDSISPPEAETVGNQSANLGGNKLMTLKNDRCALTAAFAINNA
jgi:hypothetical protein